MLIARVIVAAAMAVCLGLPLWATAQAPYFETRDLQGAVDALNVVDLHGKRWTAHDLKDRVVLIDFWATWCAPCERQVPVLNAFHDKYGDRIPVLGIAVDAGGAETVGPFVAQHGLRYRVLLGDPGLAQDYEALGFPTLFVVRPDGTIHSAHAGVVTPEALEAAVAEWAG
jgi:thiol-disulfide isomerase/thioredoxin